MPTCGQLVLRADAGQQQELRRADGAGGQHDLARGAHGLDVAVAGPVLDAGGGQTLPLVGEEDPLHGGVGDDDEVVALGHHRLEEGVEGRGALAVLGGGLEQRRDPLRPGPVAAVVVAGGDAGGDGRVDELLRGGDDG